MVKFGIGTVTYNNPNREILKFVDAYETACAESRDSVDSTLLCIDNGESSNLQSKLPYTVCPSVGNVGFGAAMNILMAKAFNDKKCDAFITANPDGFFHHKALERFAKAHLENPNSILEAAQFPEEHPKKYDIKNLTTDWASGCCMFIPRSVYERIGGFDEGFFMYLEDLDFSWRARLAGFDVKFLPNVLYSHPVMGRASSEREKRQFLVSGRYLGHKWKSKKFKIFCENALETELGVRRNEFPSLKQSSFRPGSKSKGIVCFDKQFSFSELRWQ